MEVVNQNRAWKIADRFKPFIIQGFQDIRDLITPIHFGDYIPSLPATVYFSVKEDKENKLTFVYYYFFHREDFSTSENYLIKKLDSHELDFEGVMMVLPYNLSSPFTHCQMLATQSHHDIKIYDYPYMRYGRIGLYIEPEGHGITLCPIDNPPVDHISYWNYGLTNMETPRFQKAWPKYKEIFNKHGVTMPDQVNDFKIKRKFGRQSDGLIYTNPVKFIEYAEECLLKDSRCL